MRGVGGGGGGGLAKHPIGPKRRRIDAGRKRLSAAATLTGITGGKEAEQLIIDGRGDEVHLLNAFPEIKNEPCTDEEALPNVLSDSVIHDGMLYEIYESSKSEYETDGPAI